MEELLPAQPEPVDRPQVEPLEEEVVGAAEEVADTVETVEQPHQARASLKGTARTSRGTSMIVPDSARLIGTSRPPSKLPSMQGEP